MGQSSLYSRVLGSAWRDLADRVRRAHESADHPRATGTFRVLHGNNSAARFMARLLRLPDETCVGDVHLEVIPEQGGERWLRRIGQHTFATTQRQGPPGILVERIGILELRFQLSVENGGILFQQVAAGLYIGPVSVPLPQWMSPRVSASEEPHSRPNHTRVRVTVSIPLLGLLMEYGGRMKLVEQNR